MKNLLLICFIGSALLGLSTLFSGCRPAKEIITETKTWETYSCDSFPVYVPANELTFDTSGVIPKSISLDKKQKKGHLTQTLSIKNGVIKIDCKEEAYQDTVQALRKTMHEFKQESKTVIKEVPVVPFWCKLMIGIEALIILGILYAWIFKS